MIQACATCHLRFDDARRSTICPHPLIMSARDLERKISAIRLIGKRVHLACDPLATPHLIRSINFTGWVTLYGRDEEFDPTELVEVLEKAPEEWRESSR